MGKLTELQIKNYKLPEDRGRHADGKGLALELLASGSKRWLFRYRIKIEGRWSERSLVLGRYPQMGLSAARKEHAQQKALIDAGEDPATKRKEEKRTKEEEQECQKKAIKNSFQNVALEWVELQGERWSKNHTAAVLNTLQKDAFPAIGSLPVENVTPPAILDIIRSIEQRGSYEIASKVLQRISVVCRYAVQTGKAISNPARDMQGVLKRWPVIHRKALPKEDLPELFSRLGASKDHLVTKAALKFIILTAVRSGEARLALWPEINFSSRLWSIPAERMKMRQPHNVPLSEQALTILEAMRPHSTSDEGFIFPGIKNPYKPLSDGTILKSLNSMGFEGKATVHGFRALFSTIANEAGCFDKDAIERQLAHRERNKVRAAYHRSEYLEERYRMMSWWGAWLEAIERNGTLVPERDYLPQISTGGEG